MIRLQLDQLNTVQDAQAMLQTAIGVEFGTLPPYLYAPSSAAGSAKSNQEDRAIARQAQGGR
jgi:hypothetical protein